MKTISSSKGTLYNFSARLIFVFSNYLLHIILGRHLGPEKYGLFGIVIALFNIWVVFLANGLRQAISKYISEFRTLSASIYKKALLLQMTFSLFLTASFFLGAGGLASFLGNTNLAGYFRFSALILPFTAVYFTSLGKLNGERHFGKEAIIMSSYYLLRLIGVISFVLILGWQINGAIGGIFFASALTCFISITLSKDGGASNDFPIRRLVSFALPVLFFSLATNLLLNLDLIFVKKLIAQEKSTGFYTAAITIARMPYFLFYAFSATLLPTISHSYAAGRLRQTRNYIRQYLRYLLIFALPLAVLISAKASNLLAFLYGAEYAAAAVPLSIIIFGIFFLSLFMLLATVLFGIGKSKAALSIQALLIPLDLYLIYCFIPRFGLTGAAWATSLTALTGFLFISILVYKELRAFVSFHSCLKIVSANLIIYFLFKSLAPRGFWLISFSIILFLLYGFLLWLFKEIRKEDFKLIKG